MEKVKISEKVISPEEMQKELNRKNKFPPIVDKKTKETFPPTKEAMDESKAEREKLSKEKLQKISNHDFLRLSFESRLQYITKNNIDSKKIASGEIKGIEFTFTFDGKFNRELWLKTTAGQVLPKEVEVVKSEGHEYKRKGLAGEFFTSGGARLIINEGTNITVEKIRTAEEIKKLQEENNKNIEEFIEKNKEGKEYPDIVSESIKRAIDPKFAILAFGEKIKNLAIMSVERQILIEEMFTEYDRIKGRINSVEKDKEQGIKVLILKEFGGKNWKEKAEKLGISNNIIKQYESNHYASKLNLKDRAEILANVPFEIKSAIEKYFPASEVENAILVAYGESGFKLNAYRDSSKNPGGGNDLGLFQINDKYHPYIRNYDWKDPETNTRIAYKIFKDAGYSWKPWYAARKIGLA